MCGSSSFRYGKERKLDRTTGGFRLGLPLCLTTALALSCGMVGAPELQKMRAPEPTLSLDAICQPQPQLTQENRWTFQRHTRLIEQILRQSLQPDIKNGIKSSKLQFFSDITRGFLSPITTPQYDSLLCDSFLNPTGSIVHKGDQFTYRFAETMFTLTDPWLIETYGEEFSADVTIEVGHKKENFDIYGNPIITSFKLDILPATTQQLIPLVPLDKLSELTARMFKIPQGQGATQTTEDFVYYDPGHFQVFTRISWQVTLGKESVMWRADTSGRVMLGVSSP